MHYTEQGLCDVAGNWVEWTDIVEPGKQSGQKLRRIYRGGSFVKWNVNALQISRSYSAEPLAIFEFIGFRCVK